GVDLRDPLKPIVPADDQAMVLPCASVMVMVVLLNDEFTCAMPDAMFLRSRRRTRVASLPIVVPFQDLNTAVVPAATPKQPVAKLIARHSPLNSLLTSSCRRWPSPDPCGCGRWCGSADHAPEGHDDDAGRDSSRGPSDA